MIEPIMMLPSFISKLNLKIGITCPVGIPFVILCVLIFDAHLKLAFFCNLQNI
jgi:hypothetical protein